MRARGRMRAASAAAWVERLSSEAAAPDDGFAFQQWLDADPGARAAYDRALDTWLQAAAPVGEAPPAASARVGWGAAVAAAAAVACLVAGGLSALRSTSPAVLQTAAGEHRSFKLADGSTVALGDDSRVVVRLGLDRREAVMKRGDAVFQVAARGLRPFEVMAGDDALHVAGTEVGVHRRDGRLRVVVRRGLVAVGPAQGDVGPRVDLPAGSELNHVEGTKTFQVSGAAGRDAFAWPGPAQP